MWNALELKNIKAKGWIYQYLKNQANGMTGHLDEVISPFSTKYWDAEDLDRTDYEEVFLGGMTDIGGVDSWVYYEQTGYWIDGMVRCAHLTDDAYLLDKIKAKVYSPLEKADEDGYIGPSLLKDGMVWAHTIYFRSWMAEYEATGDERILDALKKHFLRVPLKDVYGKNHDVRIMTVRDIADIEIALWIYEKTGDKRFLKMSEDSYRKFNKNYQNDRGTAPHAKMNAVTIKGMLADNNANNNHGVTYCELCKLAAILYKHTGKEIYRQAAVKAFDKVYDENILIDGVISSTEYLNGNKDSWASHETCDVSDFTWALGYLFMITGDFKYSDWVEDCIFNGGLGAVSDDFRSNQYFSCPNQVLCNDSSNHNIFFRGSDWMSYAPVGSMACCTGNVNRFMPNYIARSWMQDENVLIPFVYAPTQIRANIGGQTVNIEEITRYPFENTVRFVISAEQSCAFALHLRVPAWATGSRLTINGQDAAQYLDGHVYQIGRRFSDGDVIEISFDDEIRFVENAGGISVKKGALLYALNIEEEKVIEKEIRGLNNPAYPHFSLYPKSQWNYGFSEAGTQSIRFHDGAVGDRPWRADENDLRLTLDAFQIPNWKLENRTMVRYYLNPRKKGQMIPCNCCFTPLVPKPEQIVKGEDTTITLVPYCTTRLRIAIFPYLK